MSRILSAGRFFFRPPHQSYKKPVLLQHHSHRPRRRSFSISYRRHTTSRLTHYYSLSE